MTEPAGESLEAIALGIPTESDPATSDDASLSDEPGRVFKETNSSGHSEDLLNTREQRLAADPGLEPALARQREDETLERAGLVRGEDGVAL